MQLRIRSWAAAFVVALALPAVPAAAEDKPAPAPAVPAEELALKITGLEAQVQQHVEEKSADAMRQDLVEVQKLLPTVTDAKLRARVTALVPKILGAAKDDVLIKAALKALGETGDASLYRHLKPFLAQPNPKDLPPFLLDAIDVASKLKADDSVNVLLALVEKSKRLEVAVAAMKAPGTSVSRSACARRSSPTSSRRRAGTCPGSATTRTAATRASARSACGRETSR
jgi:hypothetical protein